MKLFLKKTIIFFGINLILLSFLIFISLFVGNQFLGNYQAAIVDKIERLQSIPGARIILVGNSNVCFGFKSDLIEHVFNMPVVDLGLHGGLGNAFLENMVKLGINEGDIVIVCHSSYSDDDTIPDPSLAWITLEHHRQLWPIIRAKDFFRLSKAFPMYVVRCINNYIAGQPGNIPPPNTCYSRNAFNQYGDIYLRYNDSYLFNDTSISVPEINTTCINRLNQLETYIATHGATLLIAGFPIADGDFTPSTVQYLHFEKELRSILNPELISHFTDYFIPYDLFYNSSLHLSEEGAVVRTNLLINDLTRWMNKDHNSTDKPSLNK